MPCSTAFLHSTPCFLQSPLTNGWKVSANTGAGRVITGFGRKVSRFFGTSRTQRTFAFFEHSSPIRGFLSMLRTRPRFLEFAVALLKYCVNLEFAPTAQ